MQRARTQTQTYIKSFLRELSRLFLLFLLSLSLPPSLPPSLFLSHPLPPPLSSSLSLSISLYPLSLSRRPPCNAAGGAKEAFRKKGWDHSELRAREHGAGTRKAVGGKIESGPVRARGRRAAGMGRRAHQYALDPPPVTARCRARCARHPSHVRLILPAGHCAATPTPVSAGRASGSAAQPGYAGLFRARFAAAVRADCKRLRSFTGPHTNRRLRSPGRDKASARSVRARARPGRSRESLLACFFAKHTIGRPSAAAQAAAACRCL